MTAIIKNIDHICVKADFSELEKIRDFVFSHAKQFYFSENDAQKITLAVDEACTNLMRYSYNCKCEFNICIDIIISNNEFVVQIIDEGEPFNPLSVESPDMKKYFAEFRKGGLGIHIMRSVMDNIEYQPSQSSEKKNILMLTKYLPNS
jgi:serine/threonine-protein kinase RsbW